MLEPGTLLSSRYRIQSILGQGGMGAVYLATMEALGGKKVAVKEMELKGFSREELDQAVKQFNKEASFLANLDHPNLVQVTDFFIEGDKHYLVMAYVQGQTLQEKLRAHGKPFTWDMLKPYAEPLVDVLHYLHTQDPPIIFRDLKPSNIMIEESGRLRLIDFGIARTAQAGDKTSTFLQGTGTSGFSPIEQYGGAQSTDQRSDIYALGATLYYILTGKIPPDAVARISQNKALVPPSQLQPDLPPGVDDLLVKALGLRQPDRQNSMAEFKQQMMAIQSGQMDSEGATEDFGALPAVGASTRAKPETAPTPPAAVVPAAASVTPAASPTPQGKSQSITVEMFPTTPNAHQQQNTTPWLIGLGSMAVAALAIFGMVSTYFPKDPVAESSPKMAATPPLRTSAEASTPPKSTLGTRAQTETVEAEETKPAKAIKTTQSQPPKSYIDTSKPIVVKKTVTQPSSTAATTSPKPASTNQKKYPTAPKYPTAKTSTTQTTSPPPPARPPQERQQPSQPVATRPSQPPPNHYEASDGRYYPLPPEGYPMPPLDTNGKPRPPIFNGPGAGGPGAGGPGAGGPGPGGPGRRPGGPGERPRGPAGGPGEGQRQPGGSMW